MAVLTFIRRNPKPPTLYSNLYCNMWSFLPDWEVTEIIVEEDEEEEEEKCDLWMSLTPDLGADLPASLAVYTFSANGCLQAKVCAVWVDKLCSKGSMHKGFTQKVPFCSELKNASRNFASFELTRNIEYYGAMLEEKLGFEKCSE